MKKILFAILGVIVVTVLVYYFFFRNSNVDLISEEDVKKNYFLKDKQAVIYLSSTADQDMDGKGISYAVFINKNGQASGYKMNGLELGGIGISDNKKELLLESKDKLKIVGENFKEFKMKYQHTGDYRAYLKSSDLFVNIYNSGSNPDTGEYDSNVVYGNKKGIQKGNIPHYLMSAGVDEETILVMTHDIDKKEYSLKKLAFNDLKMKLEDVTEISLDKNMSYSSYSSILSDSNSYYTILVENDNTVKGKVYLFRINRTTLKQELILLSSEENTTASIPFTKNNSAYLRNNELYFINGLGNVMALNTQTNTVNTKFKIDYNETDGVRYNEQTFFQGNQLHVLRYDKNRKNSYYIEVYSLKDGKKIKETEISGMEEIFKSVRGGKSIHAYDFKVLD
ncbi:hypothetical protein COL24_30145 [Bacillus toyonensis]|uniref:hypothetical protein n=1 Tax=Bacillus toyonensis TaxID=155322 RepID=UPI000BF1E958|nr:hypothetical protein [Bacillus toyonensis]PEL00897.1 hypothetical protein CN606_19260 [Bacillus toyonensis]PEO29016.1 hypothetical protein CN589_12975 [Bacillus toyonensis]PEO73278.1 hypothetical protein CN570_29060 [Bacillus toyonensis]PFX35557.1 hypothetical protein COL24_30145 [Bacillus toyonensis]PFX98826.1 hypothetical protein COL45_26295 [Bacillus toyonensis]